MSGTSVSLTLSLYIISIVIALILSILKKNNSQGKTRKLLIIHVALFISFLISLAVLPSSISKYSFLLFFCSGIISGGYLFRTQASKLMQIYFALYFASIIVFIYSPSLMVRAISLNITKTNRTFQFHITGNYFLEEQRLMMNNDDSLVQYKITQHFGVFHKTLARDIRFGKRIDSLKVLLFNPSTEANLRAYVNRNSIKFAGRDSLDINVRFNLHKDEIIQKKK